MRRGARGFGRWGPRALASFVALRSVAAPSDARADEDHFTLDYSAPHAGCPTRDQALALVVARLGFDPFIEKPDREAPTLRMMTEKDEDGLRVKVERFEHGASLGDRVLTDPRGNCAELIASAAFTASLLVDPTGALRKRQAPRTEPAPTLADARADDPFAAPPETPPPPPPRSSSQAEPMRPSVGMLTVGSVGVAPSASFGVAVVAGVALAKWGIRAEGRMDFPAESAPLANGTAASASLLVASLVPCYAIHVVRLCLVGTVGAMRGESVNVTPVERDSTLFSAIGARGGLEVPLGRTVSLAAHVEALAPLRRLTIRAQGIDLWTAPSMAGSLGAGLVVHLL